MTHNVSLIIYHGAAVAKQVPAHWAIMVAPSDDPMTGRVYHAIGNPFQGYQPEIKESYDLEATRRRHTVVPLGQVNSPDWSSWDGISQSIPRPGISPSPLDPFAGENCQDWAVNFVQALVNNGILDPSAVASLEAAPKV
ncbi:hypothetical protein PG990_009106 [Apiospora arundinis]